MDVVAKLKREISRKLSAGSLGKSGRFSFRRQGSLDLRPGNASRFAFGRQSSLDPNRRSPLKELAVPENLDSTMQLLFMASRGDAKGIENLLKEGVDVNSIDLDGRTALHIVACEGHVDVVRLLLSWKANIDARDRWGSTPALDAKFYGNVEVFNLLRARGAKIPKTGKTPMTVSNPQDVPEYELNPFELEFRRGDELLEDVQALVETIVREFQNSLKCTRSTWAIIPCSACEGTNQVAKWNGTKVSVKILGKESYSNPDSINAFKHELTLLQKVRHPNVVQFVGAVTQHVPMMIISEYHPIGDLGSYLQQKGRLKIHKALRYALDIARGVNYLHECKPDPIIHCDLKPKNILLDNGGQLKVSGFGWIEIVRISPDKFKLTHPVAHIDSLYMAPEICKNELFDRDVDAFSFSLILYEMIEGAPPFHPKAPEDSAKMICLEGMRPPFKNKSKNCPPELKELIEECWNPQPTARPTFSEIILRLDKLYTKRAKKNQWKDSLKLPWK